jgi:predicted nucleotidyltransferase
MHGTQLADAVSDWASENEAIEKVWLFGSRAKGTNHAASDFDIAVMTAPPHVDLGNLTDWAFQRATSERKIWQGQLEQRLHMHVSVECFPYGFEPREFVDVALLIWSRRRAEYA